MVKIDSRPKVDHKPMTALIFCKSHCIPCLKKNDPDDTAILPRS
jgi:hypothetical protein